MILRTLVGVGCGWLWAAALIHVISLTADAPQRKPVFQITDVIVASFLIVAVPVDRSRASAEVIDVMRKALRP